MSYTKANMVYDDYKWTAHPSDDPRVTGKPDSTRFNRHEGYEVLYLINHLTTEWSLASLSNYQKMEKMIRLKLPSTTIMQVDVKAWINNHWNDK